MDSHMRSNTGRALVVAMLMLGLTLGVPLAAQADETS